ncbi:ArsR family transcriptional regulator [Halogeometricum salsisoli]|uniref:ArsR family transcriptional regulator n=1 Tax=Halogeometricum salsisoli TaxID=2950536 RepID=UPI003CCDC19E
MTRENSELRDLPPSAKLVYKTLEYTGESTQQQIIKESQLSPRTVRNALQRLKEIDAVTEDVFIPDARKSIYRIVN